jgi:serine/threonine protein kinase
MDTFDSLKTSVNAAMNQPGPATKSTSTSAQEFEARNQDPSSSLTLTHNGTASVETMTTKIGVANDPLAEARTGSFPRWQTGDEFGKYQILSRLGHGGMGVVYGARHKLIDHRVALKVMLPHLVQRPELQQRFLQEAQLCVSLQHPNLVRTFDVDASHGSLYLTMELLDGSNLAETVEASGPIPSELVYTIVRQIASALAYAHSKGIVHRDIKPHNIMLTASGDAKVLDLGLAGLRHEYNDWQENSSLGQRDAEDLVKSHLRPLDDLPADERLTATGAMLGTLAYMAPEQARCPHTANARSDLFSLGCTAYFLLTGRTPHQAYTPGELLLAKLRDRDWAQPWQGDIPADWRPILSRMIAWNVTDRYASMDECISHLDRSLSGEPLHATITDDLAVLREQLVTTGLVCPSEWEKLALRLNSQGNLATMSTPAVSSPSPVGVFDFLFALANTLASDGNGTLLTQFQLQKVLAGQIATLRLPEHVILRPLSQSWKGEAFQCRHVSNRQIEVVRIVPQDRFKGLTRPKLSESQLIAPESPPSDSEPVAARCGPTQNDKVWIAAPWIEGDSLRSTVQRLRNETSQSNRLTILHLAKAIAQPLADLHRNNSLHLDLTCDRFVRRQSDGNWCLLDCEIASWLLPPCWSEWPETAFLPLVMAPEMIADPPLMTPSADIYALGQLYQFLITGEFPVRSMTNRERRERATHVGHSIPRDSADPFQQLVNRMTASVIQERPQSIDDVLCQLEAIGPESTHLGTSKLTGDECRPSRVDVAESRKRPFHWLRRGWQHVQRWWS